MDARFVGTQMNNGECEGPVGPCTTVRHFNSTYQCNPYMGLNQKCLKRNYDEMSAGYVGGPGQVLFGDGCFPKPIHHHQQQQQQQHHQMLYRHQQQQQPYSIPFGSPLHGDMQHLVQEPKFPPQTFEMPDIQDSNSVFSSGHFDSATMFGAYSTNAEAIPDQSYFYGSTTSDHSQCRSLVPSFPTWQPGGAVVSSAGSTTSSPISQADDSASSTTDTTALQQTQQTVKINNTLMSSSTSSQPAVSRIPNKKARSPKRRKRKDPNEPQKPVSAYSLFFRNAQAAIKSQNPSATFGDVSKIVASMWDGLDDEVKNFYKRQMEVAKKEYLKQLAIYRATLVSKDVQGKTGNDGDGTSGAQLPSPSTQRSATPKAEDVGAMASLSPVTTSLCFSSSGYAAQNPISPGQESMGHMMSPQAPPNHHQTPPLYFSDGHPNPCLPVSYSAASDVSLMRNSFLSYSQKLDRESVVSGIPEHGTYFHGMVPESGYKSREFVVVENDFNNHGTGNREIIAGRLFVESNDGSKLT